MSISVVIPAHSYPHLAPLAIDSALKQRAPADHVILVVDGMADRYMPILKEFHDIIEPVVLLENKGVSAARNEGLQRAAQLGCDHAYLLDEDDLLEPYALLRMQQAEWMVPEAEIYYPDRVTFGTYVSYTAAPEFDIDQLMRGPFMISTVYMRLSAWQKVREKNGTGFDEDLHGKGLRWEDYLFFLEAALLGIRFCHVGMAMSKVRIHDNEGDKIANSTIDEWRAYADEKLGRLYGKKEAQS